MGAGGHATLWDGTEEGGHETASGAAGSASDGKSGRCEGGSGAAAREEELAMPQVWLPSLGTVPKRVKNVTGLQLVLVLV